MAVRLAVAADIPRIVDMVCALRAAISGPVVPEPAKVAETVMILMGSPSGIVLVSDGGFIAGSISSTIISTERFAHELGWFATDNSGLRLLRAFEAWADSRVARVRLSTGPEDQVPARLREVLHRRGYRPYETAWVK
ncbi:hypothetical protein DSM110277_02018 [Sulfitobacter pontiacus]|uniref:N-acetyltransferase domain-containing protein n=1 Tax=Sulfitobacter pontiacus TaxID=60137 RepID=A0AAX3ACU9_9RHOB|nr:hypothetical protein [Sulfitobacter pontiacus]UOA23589.1 hypothetical protein DSM110277_02018 [Sulfitobacter pontiacus]